MTVTNFHDPINTLFYLRNDDFGWGEFKTQATRLTNTCEAVWALSVLEQSIHESTVNFLLKAVKGENTSPNNIQNCSIPRDYGWALIALTHCNLPIDSEEYDICLKKLISDFSNLNIGGFGTRAFPNEYSTFHTAIILIGLIKLYIIRKNISYPLKEEHIDLINSIIEESEGSIIDKGWGSTKEKEPLPAYTAYILYAFCLYHNNISKKTTIIKNAIKYLEKADLEIFTFDEDSRPDQRPYRHFTFAWSLIAISEFKDIKTNNLSYYLAKKLLSLKTRPYLINADKNISISGWGLFHTKSESEAPTTWATSLASIALSMFCKRVNCFDILNVIDDSILKNSIPKSLENKPHLKPILKSKNVFLMHGHDTGALRDLEKLLRESFNLNPIILIDKSSEGSSTAIEKFEKHAKECSFAIAIFTSDDEIEKNESKYSQARPNVIWEFGWFAGSLGRENVILILRKGTSVFSNIDGIIKLEYNENVKEVYLDLSRELENKFT